ncbi:MAG: hypothetical protein EP338_12455 [Bacteroidetes bacterium]|nr:MAG: hypothetical protein EP338_12455 [Bacteroidota bacterium]
MNWGKGIILAMGLFISFIVVLIVIFFSNRIDLVSENYYEQEISYESEILARQNWQQSQSEVAFELGEEHLSVKLPEIEGVTSYKLELYRPNDIEKDLLFEINDTKTFLIDRKQLEPGQYEYKIRAAGNGKEYLNSGKYYVK